MRTLTSILLLASFAIADPTTQPPKDIAPKTRPQVLYTPAIVDYSRPAFIPEFAKNKSVPALQEQREWALRFQPIPAFYGVWDWPAYAWYGCYPYAYGGYGWTPSHGMWP